MTTTSPRAGHSTGGTPSRVGSLWLSTTKRPCTAISPLQQLELEQLTADEIGLSEEILAENAGRGIAEAAILYTTDLTASSPILILAGNHKTGIRAACACRHLRSRGYRVTLCVLGMEREDEFIEGLTKQIKIVKKLGAKVVRWQEFAASLTATDYMPDLIIDALFGIHVSYDELRVDDQATVYEAINWVNHSDIEVMSIDIPSGLSATNGERSTIQGSVLCVEPSIVLCLAAPKTGLLHALGAKYTVHWQLFVIDIGIGAPVWKKFGNRRRHGVHFGSSWIVPLMYQDASS
ncbi:enhancer of mRNA decapping [Ascosphaera atra]|nr:enhancer of mRNA decapping [Ascosphaera atra]